MDSVFDGQSEPFRWKIFLELFKMLAMPVGTATRRTTNTSFGKQGSAALRGIVQ